MQTAEKYPATTSNSKEIIGAAQSRANFWKYPLNSTYTVTVNIVGILREVTHDSNTGKYMYHGVGLLN